MKIYFAGSIRGGRDYATMLSGNPRMAVAHYHDLHEAKQIIQTFIDECSFQRFQSLEKRP